MDDVVRDILAGNKERFRVIVREYGDDLLRVAYHFVRDWDDARDVTQQTFIRCYVKLRSYDSRRPFRPWLYRIHLNGCKSAARRLRQRSARLVSIHSVEEPSRAAETADDSDRILREMDRLPPRQKAAFVLIEIENFSSSEAAHMLGCSDSTVRVHLARAKQTLRERLKRLGISDE